MILMQLQQYEGANHNKALKCGLLDLGPPGLRHWLSLQRTELPSLPLTGSLLRVDDPRGAAMEFNGRDGA